VSRLEYCLENMEMRKAIAEMKQYAIDDRKIEGVEFMREIVNRKLMFESLIQWVKVVYASELKGSDSKQSMSIGFENTELVDPQYYMRVSPQKQQKNYNMA
jgi:predicted DNA-binding ArsR family transcriptional regulator